jgi:putative oxidoreductase
MQALGRAYSWRHINERKARIMLLQRFLATDSSTTLLVQRLVLSAVILPHGLQKLVGWFGGYGFSGTLEYFTGALGVPAPLAVLVILGESLGALALIAGLGTRLAAGGLAATMLGAMLLVHLPHGLFMNWSGAQGGEGFEFHLLALALAIPLAIRGGGAYAVDRGLARLLDRYGARDREARDRERARDRTSLRAA